MVRTLRYLTLLSPVLSMALLMGCDVEPKKASESKKPVVQDDVPVLKTYTDNIPSPWKVISQHPSGISVESDLASVKLRRYPEYQYYDCRQECTEEDSWGPIGYRNIDISVSGARVDDYHDMDHFKDNISTGNNVSIKLENDFINNNWKIKAYSLTQNNFLIDNNNRLNVNTYYYRSDNGAIDCRDTFPIEGFQFGLKRSANMKSIIMPEILCVILARKYNVRIAFVMSSFDRADLPKLISMAVDVGEKATHIPHLLSPEEA